MRIHSRPIALFGLLSAIAALAGVCLSDAIAQTATTRPATQAGRYPAFSLVVQRDFAKWDLNHDGTLEPEEIDRIVLDPTIAGDEAAAAAALKVTVRARRVILPPLTKQYFYEYGLQSRKLQMERRASTAPLSIDDALRNGQPRNEASTRPDARQVPATQPAVASAGESSNPNWDLIYRAARYRIHNGQQAVWPTSGLSLDHIRQGPLGDCYFVSVVGAMVARDPKAIERMVEPIDGGRFCVSLPATKPVIVGPLTDAQLAISSTTVGDGVWLALLEQAFGRYRASTQPTVGEGVDMSDLIAHGGNPGPTITALTGHPHLTLKIPQTMEKRTERQQQILDVTRHELSSAMQDHRLIAAMVGLPTTMPTGTPPTIPPGITTKHAYAVLGYDSTTDTLHLWNPHGQTFRPKSTPGLTGGYPTEHGRFDVPLAEAYQFLAGFSIESKTATPMLQR